MVPRSFLPFVALLMGACPSVAGEFTARHLDGRTFGGGPRLLEDRIHYIVTNDVTFAGEEAGASALTVADGASVRISIFAGATLTCTGADGAPAVAGGTGGTPSVVTTNQVSLENGISYWIPRFGLTGTAAGGAGAGGGGAGIAVPKGASLAVYGPGRLIARGGAGGAACVGGSGGEETLFALSWYVSAGNEVGNTKWASTNNFGHVTTKPAGTSMETHSYFDRDAQPGSGGGGGGGAGGGGAGLGSPGAVGGTGGPGGAVTNVWHSGFPSLTSTGGYIAFPSGRPPMGDPLPCRPGVVGGLPEAASACGSVYIGTNLVYEIEGGAGGAAATSSVERPAFVAPFTGYTTTGKQTVEWDFYFNSAQAGGAGGAGGAGAACGAGGNGAQGGTGGDSGAVAAEALAVASHVGAGGADASPRVCKVVLRLASGAGVECRTLADAVGQLDAQAESYGATLEVVGDVTDEEAKVPSGSTVVVAESGEFDEPTRDDLRHDYYEFPVEKGTDAGRTTYSFRIDGAKVVPVITSFAVTNGTGRIGFTNVWEDLYYQAVSSPAPSGFAPDAGKIRAVGSGGTLELDVSSEDEARFYRVGVTDDPRGALP